MDAALREYLPSLDSAWTRNRLRREYWDKLGNKPTDDEIRKLRTEIDDREMQERLRTNPRRVAYYLMRKFGKTATLRFVTAKMDRDDDTWREIHDLVHSEYLWNTTPALRF